MKTVMKFSNNLLVTIPIFREFYPWEVSVLKKSKMSELLDELPCHLQRTNVSLSSLPPPSLSFSSLHLLAYQQNAHLCLCLLDIGVHVTAGTFLTANDISLPKGVLCLWYPRWILESAFYLWAWNGSGRRTPAPQFGNTVIYTTGLTFAFSSLLDS